MDDKNVVANYERGELYRMQNTLPRAESYYTKALQSDPNYAPAELGLARVMKAQNKLDEYKTHLEKARALDPNNAELKKELAQ